MMANEKCSKCGAYMEEDHCGFIVGHPVGGASCLTAQLEAAKADAKESNVALWKTSQELSKLREAISTPDKFFASQIESAASQRVAALQAENERLREAARAVWESQCDAVNIDGSVCVDWELLDQLAALAPNDKEQTDDRG